jgi:hypothetical protein
MSKESLIVLGGIIAVLIVLVGVRIAYDDIVAFIYKPTAEEIAQGEQAIDELETITKSTDTDDLIAAVAPCSPGRAYNSACVTMTPNWRLSQNRQQIATDIWKNWANICTSRHLAGQARECFIKLRSDTGESLGGSGDEDASRIWLRE